MSQKFRVLITDRAWPDCAIERDILGHVGAEVVEAPNGDEATLVSNWPATRMPLARAGPTSPKT